MMNAIPMLKVVGCSPVREKATVEEDEKLLLSIKWGQLEERLHHYWAAAGETRSVEIGIDEQTKTIDSITITALDRVNHVSPAEFPEFTAPVRLGSPTFDLSCWPGDYLRTELEATALFDGARLLIQFRNSRDIPRPATTYDAGRVLFLIDSANELSGICVLELSASARRRLSESY